MWEETKVLVALNLLWTKNFSLSINVEGGWDDGKSSMTINHKGYAFPN